MVRARGVTPPPERRRLLATMRKEGKVRAEVIQAVKDAHTAGGSVRDIAELTGRSTNTIQRWLKD